MKSGLIARQVYPEVAIKIGGRSINALRFADERVAGKILKIMNKLNPISTSGASKGQIRQQWRR